MRAFLLLLLLIPNMVYAQWNYEDIERTCNIDDIETFSECTHAIRINEGLYSLRQMPYLLTWLDAMILIRDWEEARDLGARANWVLNRNAPDIPLWRDLQRQLVRIPETNCFRRDYGNYVSDRQDCKDLRYYVADCFIMALDIQQKIYAITGTDADRTAVGQMATVTAVLVNGIEGPEFVYDERSGSMTRNLLIRQKYLHEHYEGIAARAK